MTAERAALCDEWREKLAHAKAQYEAAKAVMRARDWDYSRMPISDGVLCNQQAILAETRALIEYRRVLTIFHELTVHGKRPDHSGEVARQDT